FRGDFYRTRDAVFRPAPPHAPEIFQGGNSGAAREMAGRLSDVYFMNGSPVEGVQEQVADVRGRAALHGREGQVRFGLNGFAVVRDTEAEALRVVEEIVERADVAKVHAFGEAVKQ